MLKLSYNIRNINKLLFVFIILSNKIHITLVNFYEQISMKLLNPNVLHNQERI